MPDSVSPQAVLQAIAELRRWVAQLGQVAGTLSDFAFEWAARNGGVPKDADGRRLLADDIARFDPQLEMSHETGLLPRRIDGVNDLAHRIGVRLDELARAAVALGCDDATAAALKGAAALVPCIAEGRAALDYPATWTEARHQANTMFQSEAIVGIPLNLAWEVALDRLEQAVVERLASDQAAALPAAGLTGQVETEGRDTPDATGLVARPTDRNAYREANKIISEHPKVAKDIKALNRILADHPEIRRWKPRQNRLSVHVGDWLRYVDAQEQAAQGVPDVKPAYPALAGAPTKTRPTISGWRCRGCHGEYLDQPERCQKCNGQSFEPVIRPRL